MDWGLLSGLGQGLQTVGTKMYEKDEEARRAELAEKLEKDREGRAESRLAARPDPAQTTYEEGEGGVTWKVIRNSSGTELERALAPKSDIDKIKKDAEKENLSIESLKVGIEGKRKEIDWGEEDRALLSPAERAQAQRVKGGLAPSADTRYSTDGSLQRTLISGSQRASSDAADVENTSIADYAESYIDDNPGVAAKYIDTKMLTENQAKDAVVQVLREFSKRGVKPTQSDFDAALRVYASKVPKAKEDGGGIKVKLTGQ